MLNQSVLKLVGITQSQYRKWCKENGKPSYKTEVKREFLEKIQKGKLVIDSNGNIITKRMEN